jgi:quinol monooxygenase YgiN
METVILHSEATVDPERRDEAVEILTWMAAESRAEPGVVDYRVTSDLEAPDTFRIIEQYEDVAAVEAHESSDHLDEFQARIEPLLVGEPTLTRYDVTAVTDMDGP